MHSFAVAGLSRPLEVIALSSREWRVSDPTKAECDGVALVGFIERVGSTYEVTALANPRTRSQYASLASAVDSLHAVRERQAA